MRSCGGGGLNFVPTMGAFHEGHLSLMREAKRRGRACVSIFVNPLQFGPAEDLSRYPRNEARDLALAEAEGVDIVFIPSPEAMYPRPSTTVHVAQVGDRWEGARRPGHFDGVATVVAKLFHLIQPTTAIFGWKDFQQCLVIRRMVEDLNLPVRLRFLDTVREPDGLAMSSRNAYLSVEERTRAPELHRALERLKALPEIRSDELESEIRTLTGYGFEVDYLAFVDFEALEPQEGRGPGAVIVAARLGKTRLIDNVRIEPQ